MWVNEGPVVLALYTGQRPDGHRQTEEWIEGNVIFYLRTTVVGYYGKIEWKGFMVKFNE